MSLYSITFKKNRMKIEIMDSSVPCPMKCATCPDRIQKMQGSHVGEISEVYNQIVQKTKPMELDIAFINDFSELQQKIEQYDVRDVKTISASLKFPIASDAFTETLDWITKRMPTAQINLGFLYKGMQLSSSRVRELIDLGSAFFKSNAPMLQVSTNNNALSLAAYEQNEKTFKSSDSSIHTSLIEVLGGGYHKNYSFDETSNDTKVYNSVVLLRKAGRDFQFSRRIISSPPSVKLDREYYRDDVISYLENKDFFKPKDMSLTLTPIGVRIYHASYNVQNPYLWFSYDEVFYLLNHCSLESFCRDFRTLIEMTLDSELEDTYFDGITEEKIYQLGQKRKELLSRGPIEK